MINKLPGQAVLKLEGSIYSHYLITQNYRRHQEILKGEARLSGKNILSVFADKLSNTEFFAHFRLLRQNLGYLMPVETKLIVDLSAR